MGLCVGSAVQDALYWILLDPFWLTSIVGVGPKEAAQADLNSTTRSHHKTNEGGTVYKQRLHLVHGLLFLKHLWQLLLHDSIPILTRLNRRQIEPAHSNSPWHPVHHPQTVRLLSS